MGNGFLSKVKLQFGNISNRIGNLMLSNFKFGSYAVELGMTPVLNIVRESKNQEFDIRDHLWQPLFCECCPCWDCQNQDKKLQY